MAKSVISELVESHPDFPFAKWLARWIKNRSERERLMENLHRLAMDLMGCHRMDQALEKYEQAAASNLFEIEKIQQESLEVIWKTIIAEK